MTKQDEEDLVKFREKERGDLVDNCYRARLIPNYMAREYTTSALRTMWTNYIEAAQRKAWKDA